MKQLGNKQHDSTFKSKYINKHIKYKWSKHPQLKGRNCHTGFKKEDQLYAV